MAKSLDDQILGAMNVADLAAAIEASKGLAKMISTLYLGLVEEGVPEDTAQEFVSSWIIAQIGAR